VLIRISILIGVAICLCSIIYILISTNKSRHSPNHSGRIDVVITNNGRGRTRHQINAIHKYMKWVNRIIIIDKTSEIDETLNGVNIINIKTNQTCFISMLKEVTSTIKLNKFVYLSDMTLPIKHIQKHMLISLSGKKRMFNFTHVNENTWFNSYTELTIPCIIMDKDDLFVAGTIDLYILSMSMAGELVYSPTINRDIILTGNDIIDKRQLDTPHAPIQCYVTFHISEDLQQHKQKKLNELIIEKVSSL
jgi:hypothetical protein